MESYGLGPLWYSTTSAILKNDFDVMLEYTSVELKLLLNGRRVIVFRTRNKKDYQSVY